MTWQTVLDALYDGVVMVNASGMVTYVNDAHGRITGLHREAAIGRFVGDVVPDTSLLEVLRTRTPKLNVITRVGRKLVVSNIVPILENEQVLGSVSVFRDISELMALNERLEAAQIRLSALHREMADPHPQMGDWVIGRNPVMRMVYETAKRVAAVNSTVLITGESGTGKEMLARFLQLQGPRARKPFISVNCAAIPETLLESELFGHAEGAFTGAARGGQPGLFEMAHQGTLLLDEVGDLPLGLQAKLLRVLEEKQVRRVGGRASEPIDVRVIAATNRDLRVLLLNGQFRPDLFYRLNVITMELPPLRARREDLPLLIQAVLTRITQRLDRPHVVLSQPALQALLQYDYPGNVRELANILEYAVVLCPTDLIDLAHLPPGLRPTGPTEGAGELTASVQVAERAALAVALAQHPTRAAAAKALGISRATLYRRLQVHGLV